jgi:hypothetical protein
MGEEITNSISRTTCDFHGKCTDLLHAAKLRNWIDGFTFPPKEGMLWTASAGFEPANSGTRGQHANH